MFYRKPTANITIPLEDYDGLLEKAAQLDCVVGLILSDDNHYFKANMIRAALDLPLVPEPNYTTLTKKEDANENKAGV